MSFHDRLRQVWRSKNSLVCVGIDPEVAKIPIHLHDEEEPFLAFGIGIVDATAPYVCAFKPQAAHFAAVGAEDQLAKLIAYIQRHYPEIPVILDAKRGDVGSTAALYTKEVFERFGADAVTVNPYLGYESISPYLDYTDRGVIAQGMTIASAQMLLELAVGCGNGDALDLADQFARHHPHDAMRLTAWSAIGGSLAGDARLAHWDAGASSDHGLIRAASRRALKNLHYG